jgi:uncharacterized protein YegP (UPF0339 family)
MITRRGVLEFAAALLGTLLPGVARADVAERESAEIRFEVLKDSRGRFHWQLVAANNKVIATSGQRYVAKADCKAGIELVRREAAAAVLKDLT